MDIKIERSLEKFYLIRKSEWKKYAIKSATVAFIFVVGGIFLGLFLPMTSDSQIEDSIFMIIVGSILVGYAILYFRSIFSVKKMLLSDLKFKILVQSKEKYLFQLRDEDFKIIAPKGHSTLEWGYFSHYQINKQQINLFDSAYSSFAAVIINKDEVSDEEFNEINFCLQRNQVLLKN